MPKKTKKECPINAAWIKHIDYKDTELLKKYLTKFNRIIPRYYSGTTLGNQKKLATAIKRARFMALLPYVIDVRVSAVAAAAPQAQAPIETPVIDEASIAL
jgi:small subunit ribosomal protein S18